MKVLCLGAHPDDIELGAGGTIHKLRRENIRLLLYAIVFSDCEDEVPEGWDPLSIRQEAKESLGSLGFAQVNIVFMSMQNKFLETKRQNILELLYSLRPQEWDLVICPSSFNSNQDHQTVYKEAIRAYRDTCILGYHTPSSDYSFSKAPLYMTLTEDDVNAKIKALDCYKSQFQLKKPYFGSEYARAIALVTGVEAWAPFAEKFEMIRWVI